MAKKSDVILVVGNSAERTGAPLLLLNLLQWVKQHSSFQFVFLLQSGGDLVDEYAKLGPVYLWCGKRADRGTRSGAGRLLQKTIEKAKGITAVALDREKMLKEIAHHFNVALILSNTVTNANLLKALQEHLPARVVSYVHEGERLLRENDEAGAVRYSLGISSRVAAVSGVVKEALIKMFGTMGPDLVPGAVTWPVVVDQQKARQAREVMSAEGRQVVLACGYAEWHKGTDIFIQVAKQVVGQSPDICFVWLGGSETDTGFRQMKYDIEKLNLQHKIKLITNQRNPADYLAACDLFLVLSRDESFSLVTAEAGSLQKPVLCFAETGGPCEIVDNDARFLVPYLDAVGMASRVVSLLQNELLGQAMGRDLYDRVHAHYTIEASARMLLNLLKEEIAQCVQA